MDNEITLADLQRKNRLEGSQKMIKETGKVITIYKYSLNQGRHEGEVCDLVQYKENGVTKVIESPLVEL